MEIITDKVFVPEIRELAKKMFGSLVKAVVDIEKEIMAIDGELHSDLQTLLVENGSDYKNLWGINIYPDKKGEGFIEFDSIINISPLRENRSRNVENSEIRNKILEITAKLIKE